MARGFRRQPPTSLVLVQYEPVRRGKPKFTLPSIPAPTFQQLPSPTTTQRIRRRQLAPLVPEYKSGDPTPPFEEKGSGRSSVESEGSCRSHRYSASNSSLESISMSRHSSSSSVSSFTEGSLNGILDNSFIHVDLEGILSPPKPVVFSL